MKAKKYIKSQGITVKVNKCYNIYQCGHVIPDYKDPKIQRSSNTRHGYRYRSCPLCDGRFKIKYKLCECGNEVEGTRLTDGPCHKCSHARFRKKYKVKKRTPKPFVPSKRKLLKKMVAASVRCSDCYRRDECLTETISKDRDCKVLPCLGCKKYHPGDMSIDAQAGRISLHVGENKIHPRVYI